MSDRNRRKSHEKKPLWRKVNTTTYNVSHRSSYGEYERGKKEDISQKSKMRTGQQNHGIDLTPLYGFLRKSVGKKWDDVYSEAKSRLPEYINRYDIFERIVYDYDDYKLMTDEEKSYAFFREGESSYHSELYVDENGLLQLVNSSLTVHDLKPTCPCCTHTFNGKEVPRHLYPKY